MQLDPANQRLATGVLSDHSHIVVQERPECGESFLFHETEGPYMGHVTTADHFVTSDVEEGVGEEARGGVIHCFQEGRQLGVTNVQLATGRGGTGLGLADHQTGRDTRDAFPGESVGWAVDLSHHPYSPLAGISLHLPHVLGGVVRFRGDRDTWDLEREGLAVCDVPVQDVEFGVDHLSDDLLESEEGHEVSSSVDHNGPVGESTGVVDEYWEAVE